MNFAQLQAALQIQEGKVVISSKTLTPTVDQLLSTVYANQPIVITEAKPGPGNGVNETVVLVGTSAFLQVSPAPQVQATFQLDANGEVQATFEYSLIGDKPSATSWKFSSSFPDLPTVVNWENTFNTPQTSLLDSLNLFHTRLVATNFAHQDGVLSVPLSVGLNFVSQVKPTDAFGLLKTAVGSNTTLNVHGTIHVPPTTEVTLPLQTNELPWNRPNVPGIQLSVALNQEVGLGALKIQQTLYRIYSPHAKSWLAKNDSFQPLHGYTGQLQIPSANLQLDLSAILQWGRYDVLFTCDLQGVSLANLAHLLDLSGGDDLLSSLPEPIQKLGDALGQLQLTQVGLGLNQSTDQGISLAGTYFTVGMPDVKWQVWDDHFTVDKILCCFTVEDPLHNRTVGVKLDGQLEIEGVPFAITATKDEQFTVYARLASAQTIPLQGLMNTYLPGIPAPGDLTIDSLGATIAPGQYYAMSSVLAQKPNPWVLDVGFASLKLSDLVLRFVKQNSGATTGTFAGLIEFGNLAKLNMTYDIPGNYLIRALFPQVKLSDIAHVLVNEQLELPSGFDLTFLNSNILIQKGQQKSVFQFATQLEGYGVFALQVQETNSAENSWGVAAGLDLSSGKASQLPALGILHLFEDFFRLQKMLLVLSTFDDPNFSFPDLASFKNPKLGGGKIQLPGKGGLVAGFNLFAEWNLNAGDQKQNLLSKLLGLDPRLAITLQIGNDPAANARLFLEYDTHIAGLPLSCRFGGQLRSGDIDLFLEGSMGVEIQGQPQTFDVKLDFVENGAFLSATVQGHTPIDFSGFQIGNLALEIGTDWEGVPSVGVAGTITSGSFQSSIAVFFDSAEPQKSLLAGAVSDLSLKEVVETFTPSAIIPPEIVDLLPTVSIAGTHRFDIPATLADDLDNLNLANVAAAFAQQGVHIPSSLNQVYFSVGTKGSVWFLTDLTNKLRQYQLIKKQDQIEVSLEAQLYVAPQRTTIGALPSFDPGYYLNGALDLFGFQASATIDIDTRKGIAIDAQMDKIVIGNKWLFSLTSSDGQSGPSISAATYEQPDESNSQFKPPHFYVSGAMSILGITRDLDVELSTSGFKFELGGQVTPLLNLDLQGHIGGLTDMGISGSAQVGLEKIDLGPLGEINIAAPLSGSLAIGVDHSDITAGLTGTFEFAKLQYQIQLDLDTNSDSLMNLPSAVWNAVKKVLSDLCADAAKWAKFVADGFIKGVQSIENVLRDVFHKTEQEIEEIMSGIKKICSLTTAALHL